MTTIPASTSLSASKPPVLIQGAMDIEIRTLVEALTDTEETCIGAWTFWQGTLDGYPVIASRTEVGLANAAASTAVAIQQFGPGYIFNQGTSGGHDPALVRGDIVVGETCFNMGAFKSDFTSKGEGIDPTRWHRFTMPMHLREQSEIIEHSQFKADARLLELVMAQACSYRNGKVVKGVIGSGDEWNREVDRINWLHQNLGTSVEEMETSAVALVAEACKVPFIGIRVLSNTDQHQQDFEPQTAVDCQMFVLACVSRLIHSLNQV